MDAWIKGAERISAGKSGATYRVPSAPWRFVWHKMEAPEDDPNTQPDEGWELPQTRAYIAGHQAPPHLWALPEHDWVGQTVPLTLSAYALKHPEGTPETNHAHAIQVEVIGWARDGLDDPDLCEWLGRRVLQPVLDAGVPINIFNTAPSTGSNGSGLNGAVRQSWAWWASFDGQCGHANVPGNSHWDPGVADYQAIARATQEEDDMTPVESQMLKALAVSLVPFYQDAQAQDARFQIQTLINRAVGDELAGNRLQLIASAGAIAAADQIAAAVVAALPSVPGGTDVDASVVKEAVKAALREGTN